MDPGGPRVITRGFTSERGRRGVSEKVEAVEAGAGGCES